MNVLRKTDFWDRLYICIYGHNSAMERGVKSVLPQTMLFIPKLLGNKHLME